MSYHSHISYSVDGVEYTDITYEKLSKKENLTPVGQIVMVDVSPEDPARTIEDLGVSIGMALVSGLMMCAFIDALWSTGLMRSRSKKNSGVPDAQTLERDMRLFVLSRNRIGFCFPAGVWMWFLCLRYSSLGKPWITVVAVICTGLCVWCVVLLVKRLRDIAEQRYRVQRDTLVRKYESYDSDSGTSYMLCFRTDAGVEWEKGTARHIYNTMKEGDTVAAVYFHGKRKPLLSYDCDGSAS